VSAPELPSGNLPDQTTGFVGRRDEAVRVSELLARSRLVTLTGVGGVGKTRLALQVADAVAGWFRDGVWLAELSPLSDPELLGHTVATALGVQDQSPRPPLDVLADHLAERRLLLVLDTCEHLVGSCALLAEVLLRAAPRVRILATSRQRLGVEGEEVLPLAPLSHDDAVALFTDRARAADPDFPGSGDRGQIESLCGRLDGIALAIELAAQRIGELTVAEMLTGLDDRFRLLSSGDAPMARHETLRTAIGWSHELCTPLERLLWVRLSAFAGDADLEAVRAVCTDVRLPADRLADLMSGLLDKSIVQRDGARYRMLDTVREYGRYWLRELGEEAAILRRHRGHYLGLAVRFDQGFRGPGQLSWLRRVAADLPDLRAALDLAVIEDPQAALEIAGRLTFFWVIRAAQEGAYQLDRALAGADEEPTGGRARALLGQAWVYGAAGEPAVMRVLAAECGRVAEQAGEARALAFALMLEGTATGLRGDQERASALLDEALALHRREGDPVLGAGCTLMQLGIAQLRSGAPEAAVPPLEEAISICQAYDELWIRSHCTHFLAQAELGRGHPDAARRHARAALEMNHRLDDRFGMAMAIETLAAAADDMDRAARLLALAHHVAEAAGIDYDGFAAIRPRVHALLTEEILDEIAGFTVDQAVAYALAG
jgi:non-specific serine/threonine protein kinase